MATTADVTATMAQLVVSALGVGGGKRERDVVDDLFAGFGLDFTALDRQVAQNVPDRKGELQTLAAARLGAAAPGPAALIAALVRCGGKFIDMLDAVFRQLKAHDSTTDGSSQTFRLERGEIDEDRLTISPAFIEQVHRLQRRLSERAVGHFDLRGLSDLTRLDDGEFYGSWPRSADWSESRRLASDVLHLGWLRPQAFDRFPAGVAAELRQALAASGEAAGQLMSAAEAIVGHYMTLLDVLAETPANDVVEQLSPGLDTNRKPDVVAEIERFRNEGFLSARVDAYRVSDVSGSGRLGVDRDLRAAFDGADYYGATSAMSELGCWVAQWKTGRWPVQRKADIEDVMADADGALEWLAGLARASREAATWLRSGGAFTPTGTVAHEDLVDLVQEFLNLPLWRARELLYEVWILCATLEASAEAGWTVQLRLTRDHDVWVLGRGGTDQPVAHLRWEDCQDVNDLQLDVWREPKRQAAGGVLTPDVIVATAGETSTVLVVVEAKDRISMAAGGEPASGGGALGVARRYARALTPRVTWVCNHCDYRVPVDPVTNYADVWAQVRLAGDFRPGTVPPIFGASIAAALAPPRVNDTPAGTSSRALLLVVDRTASMDSPITDAATELLGRDWSLFAAFRAVVYTDHDGDGAFLLRKFGPYSTAAELVGAITAAPARGGGDVDEALEDALQRCNEIVADTGPQQLLVITDAPPHPRTRCPNGIDYVTEVETLLASGCAIYVADDWQRATDRTWERFVGLERFSRGPLREFR